MIKQGRYLNGIIQNIWSGEANVIAGIRKCRKSDLLFDLFYNYLLSEDGHST